MQRRIGLSAAIGIQPPKINEIFKTSGRYAPATTNSTVNRNFFCANNALFATGNVHTAKWRATGRFWTPTAADGPWADTLFTYTHKKECNIPLQYFFITFLNFKHTHTPRAQRAREYHHHHHHHHHHHRHFQSGLNSKNYCKDHCDCSGGEIMTRKRICHSKSNS